MSEERAGCLYRDHFGAAACNKICDDGQTLCPFHLLLTSPEHKTTEQRMREATRPTKTPRGYEE